MESKLSFKTGILFVNLFVLTAVYGQIPEIPDIEISMKVWIRGDLTDAEMHSDIADIDITVPGHYRIYANAFYNSGDDQLNESFYLLVRNADGTIEYPVDANAGPYKVVVDDPGPKHGAWRDGGLFYFSAGRHVVELHHYYVIADIYPQFINIVMGGSESVRLDGIRVAYEPFQDGAVDINGNTPRIMPMNGSNVGVVYPGETFPYRIEIDNKERDILYAPRLICQIPGYVETDQFSLAPDEREGNKMYWNLADMNGQGKVAIDFTAKVPEPWNNGTTPIFSRAWLVVEQDRDPADNSDSDLDYIYIIPDETDTLLADLHLKIDSYPDSSVVTAGDTAKYAHGGDTLPYKVSFVNLGPDTAFNVSLINHLPRNVVAENFNLEPNESLTGVLVWNFAFVAPFTNIDITYNAQIDASLNIKDYLLINNALVSSPNDTILYNNFDSDTVIVNPLPPTPTDVPDLAVLHTVTTDTMVYIQNVLENAVRAGKSYQCRISVQNIGQAGAKNVKMWNFLPDSIRVDEFNIPFHYDFQNRIYWNYDSLAAGGSIDIDYTATVFDTLPFTPFPLTSQVGVFAEREVNTLNNFAQQTIYAVVDSDLVEPDLTDISVSQIATTDTFQMTNGDTVKFAATGKVYNIQIIVKNNGKTGAKDILITDVLPDSVSAVRFSPLPAHVASDSLKWFVSELAVRADTIMSIDVQVSENMPLGQNLLINRARVTAENEDPAFLYNNVSVDTVYNEGIPKPDTLAADVVMSLTSKTDSLGLDLLKYTRPGGEIEYQIKIVNTGPDTAYQMSVDNSLPRFVRVFDITPAPASTDSASIKWQFLSLAPDVRLDLTFKAQVDSPLVENKVMLLDSVRISARNDTVLTNNCAVDTVWAVQKEPVIPRYADLEIGKTALPVRTVIGNDVVFQVFLKNTGPDAATNIRIQDLLPDGMGYVSGAANVGIFDPQTRIWTIDALGVDAVAILSITASAKSAGWWTNSAFVAAADQNDPDLGNNAAYATVVVMEKDSTLPDLRLQKSADKAQMNIGENILFTIHLTNDGPVAANDIRVLDAIHPAFTYVSGQTGNGSYQPETALWQIDTLQVGATATLKIAATAKREGLAVNYAKITQVSPGDADGTNNDDAVYVNVGAGTLTEADLAVSKSILSLPDVPRVGDHVEFEIKITNLSSVTAQNVCVLERMPDGLSYISFSPVESDYSAATGIWNVRTLDAGESRVLILRAEILRTGKIKNCVHIENSDRQDPDVDNNESCAEIDIPVLGADIGVEVFVSPKWVQRNETADFNVLVTNHGPMSASVQVQNRFPAGLNLDFSSTATGEYNANSEVWNVGSLAAGDTAMLELNGTGKQLGLWTHYARILASDQTDPDSSNNSAAADAVVWEENTSLPDIHLVKSVNNPRVGLGESVIFTLVVANTGPHTARHIQVFDRMHPGFALQSFTADKGIFDAEWRIWAIDSLVAGESVTLRMTAKTLAEGVLVNYAQVTAVQPGDSDWNNNDDMVFVTVTHSGVPEADLSINKTIVSLPAQPKIGDEIHFAITVRNHSETTPTFYVRVFERIPVGLEYLSHTPATADYNERTSIWNVGTILPGESVTLTITAEITKTGRIVNCSHIENSSQPDPDYGNEESCAEIVVNKPSLDIGIDQTAQTDSAVIVNDDTLKYAVSGEIYKILLLVSNPSQIAAENVVVRDILPGPVKAAFIDPQPSVAGADTLEWFIPLMAAGSEFVFSFDARLYEYMPVGTNLLINTATVQAQNEQETLLDNNVSVDTVYNYVAPIKPVQPVIESNPPVVPVENTIFVRVQVPEPVKIWDLWIYLPNGQIDSTFADDYIGSHDLSPNTWYDVEPGFTENHLMTADKYDDIIFEIRTVDFYNGFGVARDTSFVKSKDHLVLDHNVFEPDKDGLLAINFRLSSRRIARLDIYDINGRLVTKVAEKVFEGGLNTHMWDGTTLDGQKVGSGVYLVTLRAGEYNQWKKFILVR